MSTAELDPVFRYALKLLHSSSVDSTEKIRISLDELIKQRHGSNKMLANTLSKKYLAEESLAPGVIQRRPSHRSSDSKTSSSNSPQQITVTTESSNVVAAPLVISVPDDDDDDDLIMEEAHLQDFQDLNCVVCGRLDASAKNHLIECADCQSLYHQECHNPQISETEAKEKTWCCSLCKNKIKSTSVASPAKSSCSTSSSSSSSYQKHISSKSFETSGASGTSGTSGASGTSGTSGTSGVTTSSKSHTKSSSKHKSSSSSKHSSKSSSSNQSSSGSGIIGNSSSNGSSSGSSNLSKPSVNINIISADKRLQNMKKKAAKMQETRRKHK